MATWAMKQRYAWISAQLADRQPFNRQDLRDKFFVTGQTCSATIREYCELYPGALRYDMTAKVFVRGDTPATPKGSTRAVAKLRRALEGLIAVRPANWDDDEDPEALAAWRAADAALADPTP